MIGSPSHISRSAGKNKWRNKYPYTITLDYDEETRAMLKKECTRIGYNVSMSAVVREILKAYLQWRFVSGCSAKGPDPKITTRQKALPPQEAFWD